MKYSNSFKITIVALLLFAIISMAFKVHPVMESYDDFLPKEYNKNRTEYIIERFTNDINLYNNYLVPLFRKRSTKCNCGRVGT